MQLKTRYAAPQERQKHFGLSAIKFPKGTKQSERDKAKKKQIPTKCLELYPEADLYSPRGGFRDGRSDEILIARYLFDSGQSLIQDAREEGLPIIAIEPEANKVIRMSNQSPLVEAGLVMLPEKAHWLYDFEQEVIHFPRSKHDDQVDTLSQLLKWQRTQSLAVALDYDDIDMSEIDDELEDFY